MAFQGQFGADGAVEFKLRIDTSESISALDQVTEHADAALLAMNGVAGIAKRMTGSEDLRNGITIFQRGIQTAIILRTQWKLLQAELGPIGIILLGLGSIGTALTIGDTISTITEVY